MRVRVLEAFVTPWQHFEAGTEILAQEIEHPVLTIEDWLRLGKVEKIEEEAHPAAAAEPAAEPEPEPAVIEPLEIPPVPEHDPA